MADCQINSISDQPSNSKDVTTIIPEGRVGEGKNSKFIDRFHI